MGYTTEFVGKFDLNKKLTPELQEFLTNLAETRRMGRNIEGYGVQGEFYAEDDESDVIDSNKSPTTQPSLWLQWIPTDDGMSIEWDGNEKFYAYAEWINYLVKKVLEPNGYVLNGSVQYSGEEVGDSGRLTVEENVVYLRPYEGEETKYGSVFQVYQYPEGYVDRSISPEVTYSPVETSLNPEPNEKADGEIHECKEEEG